MVAHRWNPPPFFIPRSPGFCCEKPVAKKRSSRKTKRGFFFKAEVVLDGYGIKIFRKFQIAK
jgi:hypothetical protein